MIRSHITHMLRKIHSWRLFLIAGVLLLGTIALVSFTSLSVASIRPTAVLTATAQPDWGKHHHTPTPTEEHKPPTHSPGEGEHKPPTSSTPPESSPVPPALPPTGSDPSARPLP